MNSTSNGTHNTSDDALLNGTQGPAVPADDIRNVVIIGSGPAGYTAALYTARANLSPLLIAGSIDKKTSRIKGGQLMLTSDIENFPAAIEVDADLDTFDFLEDAQKEAAIESVRGTSGPNLMKRMELQARHFGTEMLEEFVTHVDIVPGGIHTLHTESGKQIRTRALIIATGAAARTLGIPAEDKFFGQGGGVSTCATCDGRSYLDKTVAVVGGGDSAMEEASYLANIVDKVYIVHRREEFRASKIMLKRAQNNPKIEFVLNAAVDDLIGKPHPAAATSKFFEGKEVLARAVLRDPRDNSRRELEIDGLFVAIGHTPNSQLFTDAVKSEDGGYLLHDGRTRALAAQGEGIVEGVFLAGDIADHMYRQAITAAGMGCQAAIEAERYVAEKTAEMVGLEPGEVNISSESIAQSHWSSERDMNHEATVVERVIEGALDEGKEVPVLAPVA
jgi:thioredoxin reductase (NADPH)